MATTRIPSVEGGIQPTLLTTKGDLISATAASTVARLAVGTDAQILVADSSTATGLKWATPSGGGGKVLQVVNATYSTSVNSTSNTYVDTGLTATITPSAITSKILVLVSQNGLGKTNANAGTYAAIQLLRGATSLVTLETQVTYTGTAVENYPGGTSTNYLDSPSTTSATTYKTQIKNAAGVGTVTVQGGGTSTITLMEIGA